MSRLLSHSVMMAVGDLHSQRWIAEQRDVHFVHEICWRVEAGIVLRQAGAVAKGFAQAHVMQKPMRSAAQMLRENVAGTERRARKIIARIPDRRSSCRRASGKQFCTGSKRSCRSGRNCNIRCNRGHRRHRRSSRDVSAAHVVEELVLADFRCGARAEQRREVAPTAGRDRPLRPPHQSRQKGWRVFGD